MKDRKLLNICKLKIVRRYESCFPSDLYMRCNLCSLQINSSLSAELKLRLMRIQSNVNQFNNLIIM